MVLTCLKEHGLVSARGRQHTDLPHVLVAVRRLSRLECIGKTLRQALNVLAVVAPGWPCGWAPPDWYDRHGPRLQDHCPPTGKVEREALAEQIGADGWRLPGARDDPAASAGLARLPAMRTPRQVWLERFYAGEPVRWRAVADLPPGARLTISSYDPGRAPVALASMAA